MKPEQHELNGRTNPDGLLKVSQVQARLNCSAAFVYDLIASGELRSYRLGKGQGGCRVSEEALQEYLKGRQRGGPEGPKGGFKHLKI